MRSITVCIPTLNRYDKLKELINSLTLHSTLLPDKIIILDNGSRFYEEVNRHLTPIQKELVDVYSFGQNIGVARSWNFFIENTEDIRIICNDDLTFEKNTLAIFYEYWSDEYITWAGGLHSANVFSCFSIPDKVVEKIGYFDEAISPNYAYFEDNDYFRRIQISGITLPQPVPASVIHEPSSTLKRFTSHQKTEHHNKFKIAKSNYKKKWGGPPGREKYLTPYNKS